MAYLQNGWYAAAFSADVTRQPMARTIMDQPIVLYRDEAGMAIAVADRCAHRFAPLSGGTLVGDEIQCPYHGLRFDRTGACTFNPHGPVPRAARIASYKTVERYGLIWMWPGESNPDLSKLPDFDFLEQDDSFSVVSGYLNVSANYQLVVDNLLDLTHAPYLHPQFGVPNMSLEERMKSTKSRLVREPGHVMAERLRPNSPPNGPTRSMFGVTDDRVDSRSNMHWYPPALLHFDLGSTSPGAPVEDGLCIPAMHAITPETEFSCHYFFAQARNRKLHDPDVDAMFLETLRVAFATQDEPMIEAQQSRMGKTGDILSLSPVLLASDAAPMAARRELERLITLEATEVAAG